MDWRKKEQVQFMVTRLLRLECVPEPADAADALAVAICHLHTAQTLARSVGWAMILIGTGQDFFWIALTVGAMLSLFGTLDLRSKSGYSRAREQPRRSRFSL